MSNDRTDSLVRLVVIDDDPALAKLVAAIARDSYPDARDLAIDPIVTAEAAVRVLRELGEREPADALIVISDFHLPPSEVDGLDILGEVKKRLPAAKRVLMTGREPDELAPRLEEAGLDAFVQKPFLLPQMQHLLGRLVCEVNGARP